MPLPERMPVPSSAEDKKRLKTMGIVLADVEQQYSAYTLPTGWSMREDSTRQDQIEYSIVDAENYIRVYISGVWKGTYDNKLDLFFPTDLIKHKEKPIDQTKDQTKEEWQDLIREYKVNIDTAEGCGERAQSYIDKAYEKLVAFQSLHPSFQLPEKHQVGNDGYTGTIGVWKR